MAKEDLDHRTRSGRKREKAKQTRKQS